MTFLMQGFKDNFIYNHFIIRLGNIFYKSSYLYIIFLLFELMTQNTVFANDFEKLCKDGYSVIDETYIYNYDFDGCEYNKVYRLGNGLNFQCHEYNYHYSYNPDVYILLNRYGNYKVIIDDEIFDGILYR